MSQIKENETTKKNTFHRWSKKFAPSKMVFLEIRLLEIKPTRDNQAEVNFS